MALLFGAPEEADATCSLPEIHWPDDIAGKQPMTTGVIELPTNDARAATLRRHG